jgi:hypothetical protein
VTGSAAKAPAPARAGRARTAHKSTFGYRLEKFLALAGVTTAVAIAIIRAAPGAWWPVGAAALFLCGLLLATTRCGAPFESDFAGVVALLVFTAAGGAAAPIAAVVGYLLFALILRSLTPTVLTVGVMNAVVTGLLAATYSRASGAPFFTGGDFYQPARMYVYFSFMLASLGGWMSSSLLLPVVE